MAVLGVGSGAATPESFLCYWGRSLCQCGFGVVGGWQIFQIFFRVLGEASFAFCAAKIYALPVVIDEYIGVDFLVFHHRAGGIGVFGQSCCVGIAGPCKYNDGQNTDCDCPGKDG